MNIKIINWNQLAKIQLLEEGIYLSEDNKNIVTARAAKLKENILTGEIGSKKFLANCIGTMLPEYQDNSTILHAAKHHLSFEFFNENELTFLSYRFLRIDNFKDALTINEGEIGDDDLAAKVYDLEPFYKNALVQILKERVVIFNSVLKK